MILHLYATVGDTVVFSANPKGWDEHKGVKGEWITKEGPTVISMVEIVDPLPENFQKKYNSIKELWPDSTVRFMSNRPKKKSDSEEST